MYRIKWYVNGTKNCSPLFCSAESGEYWRLLTPGYYELVANKDGYNTKSRIISIDKTIERKDIENVDQESIEAETVDFVLDRPPDDLDENNLGPDDYIRY